MYNVLTASKVPVTEIALKVTAPVVLSKRAFAFVASIFESATVIASAGFVAPEAEFKVNPSSAVKVLSERVAVTAPVVFWMRLFTAETEALSVKVIASSPTNVKMSEPYIAVTSAVEPLTTVTASPILIFDELVNLSIKALRSAASTTVSAPPVSVCSTMVAVRV